MFEVEINTVEGEIELWKDVCWGCRFVGLQFPLKDVSNVRKIGIASCTGVVVQNSAL